MREFFDSKRGQDLLAEFRSCSVKFGFDSKTPTRSWGDGGCSPFAIGTCRWLANHGVQALFVGSAPPGSREGHASVRIGNEYLDGIGIHSALPAGHIPLVVGPCANVDELPVDWQAGDVSLKVTQGLEKALGAADKLFCPGSVGLRGFRRRARKRRR